MAGKPELSAAPGVQNVVVYVSNDNFAQAYTVNHSHAATGAGVQPAQNEGMLQQQPQAHQGHQVQNGVPIGYPASVPPPMVPKIYHEKMQQAQVQAQAQAQVQAQVQHQQQLQMHLHHQQQQHQQMLDLQVQQQQVQQHQQHQNQQQHHQQHQHQQPQHQPQQQQPGGYFTNQAVITHQNGFTHQPSAFNPTNKPHVNGKSAVQVYEDAHQARTTLRDEYHQQPPPPSAATGYLVMGGEAAPTITGRCDSVRSETAESSCSSVSSADDNLLIVPNNLPADAASSSGMLVYEGGSGGGGVALESAASGVNVRHGVVVAVGGPHATGAVTVSGEPIIAAPQLGHHQQQLASSPTTIATTIAVPYGWKRLISNGVVIYISPSNTALSSLEHVKDYLLTPTTCKCGLECPLKCDVVFNFDPKVMGKPWTFTPDSNNGDLTKLCNHKRKFIEQLKDCNQLAIKKKKRKMCGSPLNPGMLPVAQTFPQAPRAEKVNGQQVHVLQQQPQFATKDNQYQQPSMDTAQQVIAQRVGPGYQIQPQVQQQPQQFIGYQNPHPQAHPTPMEQPSPSIVLSGDQLVSVNPNISSHHTGALQLQVNLPQQHQQQQLRPQIISSNGHQVLIPAGNGGQPHPQRVFINGQPSEPSGPGRPVQMIPVSIATNPSQAPIVVQGHGQQRPEKVGYIQANGQIYQTQQGVRQFIPSGIRHQLVQQQPQVQPKMWSNRVPSPPNQIQPQGLSNAYERVPPLHQHQMTPVQVQVWPEEVQRKKAKTKVKKRYDTQTTNIDRGSSQFPSESSSPSFLDDPSGYLAQQTALLNNTINRQNNFACNSPQPSQPPPPTSGVPLPSNMKPYRHNQHLVNVKVTSYNQPADSALDGCVIECHIPSPGPNDKFPGSHPGTPDPVTSSNYPEKHSPDSRPIQGGTVSTSNVSPVAIEGEDSGTSASTSPTQQDTFYIEQPQFSNHQTAGRSVVTTMASGRTVGSNTITSVLAGRANTATVSITNPPSSSQSRSPLEMVQSVVSSIKLPQSQILPQQVVHKGLPPGHILVSSGGQLIMATTNANQMPPPPPKIQTSMPPISVSPMVTNVTASVTQMIPAVAQQVLGQQTVLVNTLPGPFVLQPGVTMTMDGMNQLQLQPQLVTGNVIQQQLQPSLLSPENKAKKGKKRKVPTPTVASMLQIAAQQNSGVVGFPQQIQMHSPQGLTATPVMQALTIVPGKAGATPQFVMNGQMPNAQIINSQSQPINLLQPVNLAQGMVQNFPTIQQIVLPTNLTGMVMNADGTATIVQQDANIGMQLQLQNVNGQNVLTPVQNNQMFTTVGPNGQSISIPSGMVIRPQGKIIQQQHSPGAQFISPTGGGQFVAQFNGQLSPLVASVSPGQQVTFSPQIRPAQQPVQQPEFIQCGQTLMVPASLTTPTQPTSNHQQQNTTFVQQNTTIVQQQTTMLSNQGSQNPNMTQASMVRPNDQQSFVLAAKEQQQQNIQAVVVQQRQSPLQQQINYRNSVSTQTAVNGHGQSVTTFCQTSTSNRSAGSPPDTTTLSPLAPGGQSPPTADTTTHTGSTDDGLSPAPSNCSDIRQSSMAMVHCVSSSEPDSMEVSNAQQEFDWRNVSKMEFTDLGAISKKATPTVEYAESSTMVHFVPEGTLKPETIGRHFEKPKRKHSDTLIVMETRHAHPSFFDDDDDDDAQKLSCNSPKASSFVEGDLVWGPAKGCPAWPGKVISVTEEVVSVRWFGGGGDKSLTGVHPQVLQTLSEGLDAHHRASKKSRTGRKLNAQLERAIQEAMAELDNVEEDQKHVTNGKSCNAPGDARKHEDKMGKLDEKRKSSGRLRSSRQAQS